MEPRARQARNAGQIWNMTLAPTKGPVRRQAKSYFFIASLGHLGLFHFILCRRLLLHAVRGQGALMHGLLLPVFGHPFLGHFFLGHAVFRHAVHMHPLFFHSILAHPIFPLRSLVLPMPTGGASGDLCGVEVHRLLVAELGPYAQLHREAKSPVNHLRRASARPACLVKRAAEPHCHCQTELPQALSRGIATDTGCAPEFTRIGQRMPFLPCQVTGTFPAMPTDRRPPPLHPLTGWGDMWAAIA